VVGGGAVWGLMDDMVDGRAARRDRGFVEEDRCRRACCRCSTGELSGTGSPGATGSGMKCYMVAAGRMMVGLARVGAEVSSVSSPRNANAGTLDGPCCTLRSLLSPISTHNLRTCTSIPWTAWIKVLVVTTWTLHVYFYDVIPFHSYFFPYSIR
jgi:hypothetical protein